MTKGIKQLKRHDDEYWNRLRREFEVNQYLNSGAYGDRAGLKKATSNFLDAD